jgi:hypothetical protein
LEGLKIINTVIETSTHKGLGYLEMRARFTRLMLAAGEFSIERFDAEAEEILTEMQGRGIEQVEKCKVQVAARAAELCGDVELAVKQYWELAEKERQREYTWGELDALKKVAQHSLRNTDSYKKAKARIRVVLAELSIKATTPPVKGLMQRFKNSWRYL